MSKFIQSIEYFKNSYLSKFAILIIDIFLSVASSAIVLFAVNIVSDSGSYSGVFAVLYIVLSVVFGSVAIYLARCYRVIIRHLGAKDLIPFALASLLKVLLIGLTLFVCTYWKSTLLHFFLAFDFLLTFFAFISVRVMMIVVYDWHLSTVKRAESLKNVLIYGISDKSVAAMVRLHSSSHYSPRGFLVYSSDTKEMVIDGRQVCRFDCEKDFAALLEKLDIDAVLFTTDSDARTESERLIRFCYDAGIQTLIVPTVDEIAPGESLFKPRPVKIEDLLGRPEIQISMDRIKENFRGKTVLVTGGAGSIGSELCRQIAQTGVDTLIIYDNSETPVHNIRLEIQDRFPDLHLVPLVGSVRQPARLDYVFRAFRPHVVFHAAAYKHVPLMEENPCEAILTNVRGTRFVADKCVEYGAEMMVMVSTDKAVNPTNIMGCTKRLAEIYVQSLGLALQKGEIAGRTKFVTTRFGNVLGSNGSVIPRFREQLENGGPLTVTDPRITRFFMTIPEACRLVMEASTISAGNEILIFDMGEPVKIDSLARKMIELAGLKPGKDIQIEYTGLRPGEKLYEEMLAKEEETLATSHDRIRISKVRSYGYDDARRAVEELGELADAVRIPEMVRLMKKIVPEYISENSAFAAYDDMKVKGPNENWLP